MLSCFSILVSVLFSLFTYKPVGRSRKRTELAALRFALAAGFCATAAAGLAQTKTATTTKLSVVSGGTAVTSVASGSVVTLTAIVNADGTAVTPGQVNFCDASAKSCTDIHLLGTAQLTGAGTATLKLRPGIGSHGYKAVFLGTNTYAGGSSGTPGLTVTGTPGIVASTTTIAETGSWGQYTLSATVTESGSTVSPTGTVSFLDTSNGNAVIDQKTLEPGVAGINWQSPLGLTLPTNSPQAVAVGDFNGDGIPDLAVSAGGPSQPLVIFLGNANGTYTTVTGPSIFTYSFGPIVTADFNGDGKQDMAVLNANSSEVAILLSNGDGTFTMSASNPVTGSSPNRLAVGDFNGDGISDLAVTEDSTNSVLIFLGKGDGTFTGAPTNPAVGVTPYAIAIGDFNGDGKLDLAVTDSYDDTVSILLGNGDGTFAGAATLHCGSNGSPIAVGDFSGDGELDLALGIRGATEQSSSVTILVGNGDGTFNAPPSGTAVSSNTISSIQLGDFNADGIPDLVLTDSNAGTFTVFLGNGRNSFTTTKPTLAGNPNFGLFSAVGDLNGDGRTDLLVAAFTSNTALVYLTEPTETATATADITLTTVGQHMVDASYAGDSNYSSSVSGTKPLWGVPPATTTSLTMTSGGVSAATVTPGTVVTLTASVNAGASPVMAGKVNFCDASASQCTDIHLVGTAALTSAGTAIFKFVPGAGVHSYKAVFVQDGYGLSSSSAALTLTVGPAPSAVYADAATISAGGSPGNYSLTATVVGYGGSVPPTGKISFLDTSFGNKTLATASLGPSTAGLGWLISQTPSTSNNPISEVTGDFNGDGIPDLALLWSTSVYSGPSGLTVFFGNGDGTFTTGSTAQLALTGQLDPYMIAGDFNGDGKADLAILSWETGNNISIVTTLLGNGDGSFAAPLTNPAFNQGVVGGDGVPGSIVAADVNGDGKMDLAVVGDYIAPGGLTVLLGNGDGTFKPAGPNLVANGDFGLVATGDFNGDGIPDLVATNYFKFGGSPTIFLGKGDGTFIATAASVTLDYFPTSIVVGDFNGDGVLDLAFSDLNGVEIALGNGDGTFKETSASPIAVSNELYSLTAGDFNHDGKLDLAGLDNYNNLIDILLGTGDGTFTPTSTTPIVSSDLLGPFSIVAADFNGDGFPDLAMLTKNQATASILLAEPTETATATVTGLAPVGAGTHNVDASYEGDSNYHPIVTATVPLTAGLVPVVISPAAGTYSSVQTVTLSESIPGATIYYSAYGPVNTKGTVPYTGPISLTLGGTETISAYATETGYQQSNNTLATFTINLPAAPTPVFSPAAGSFSGPQTVTISDTAANATIYYTTDGSYPTTSSKVYTGPITVSTSETLGAIVTANGYDTSNTASAQYFIDSSESSFIYTLAGTETWGYAGDGGLATEAILDNPFDTAVDSAGNVYIADNGNNVVRKIAAGTGIITTVAGTGIGGYSGDNGPATSAQLWYPCGLAIDSAGNLYIADNGNRVVRMIAAGTGTITTYAGSTTATSLGDKGLATMAQLAGPIGLAFDTAGNLYISDQVRVRKVTGKTGIITTVAGNGNYGYAGDNGPATSAAFTYVTGLALDKTGNLYIADEGSSTIRMVAASTAVISTVAGKGPAFNPPTYSGDGGPATSAQLYGPYAVAVDAAGNLYIADTYNQAIREVTASNRIINTIVGHPASNCVSLSGDGAPAIDSAICSPTGLTLDSAGNIYIAESSSNRIRKITKSELPPTKTTAAPIFNAPAGTYVSAQSVSITDATPGAEIYLTMNGAASTTGGVGYHGPINLTGSGTLQAIAVAPGHLPSAPVTAAYVITTPPTTVVSTVAGNGTYGGSGVGGPAISAELANPNGVAFDSGGNLFIADQVNNVVWRVAAGTGTISVVAGILGRDGSNTGNGGPATSAYLNGPTHVAFDSAGNMYIADSGNNEVRMVAAQTGIISVYAGGGHDPTKLGDGGLATAAFISYPQGIVSDSAGNLYIADEQNQRIRMVSAVTGNISTVAGGTTNGLLGDGGQALSATLSYPTDVAVDSHGNLYIADTNNGRVRIVSASTGVITTVAGNGSYGTSGDGGPATTAEIYPLGLALDNANNLYISNSPGTVRMVPAGGGTITTVAGNGFVGFYGDGGSATMAEFCNPEGLAFDKAGSLYIADTCNYRVRKVSVPAQAATPSFSPAAGSYTGAQSVTITDTTQGAAIYYTTDGSTPTTGSNLFSGSITVSSTETVKAIAAATGYTESPVASAAYVINQLPAPTLSAVVSSLNPSLVSNPVTFTASVTAAAGAPTGSIAFFDGTTQLGSGTLSAGAATYTTSALTAGSHSITAVYSGDQNFGSATSAALTQTVESFTIAPSSGGSSSATVTSGGKANYALSVTPPSGGAALTFSVTGLPSGATGTFSPSTVPSGSGPTNVTLTVSMSGTAAARPVESPFNRGTLPTLLGLIVLPFAARLRKTSLRRLSLVILGIAGVAMAASLSGCGGGGSSSSPPTSHTYTLTVVAMSGSLTQSTTLTLTVE